jgi:hypothetical protein
MLPDAGQALLFDRTKGTYVAVGAGEAVEGFTVDSVEDDEVTLVSDAGATVVLAAPARHRRAAEPGNTDDADEAERPVRHRPRAERVAAAEPADPYGGAQQPADPYAGGQPADPYAGGPQPADPYGDGVQSVPAGSLGTGADGVRVVDASAPAPQTITGTGATTVIGTGADGVRVTSAAAGTAPATGTAPAAGSALATGSAPAAVSATGSAPATASAPATLTAAAPASVAGPASAAAPTSGSGSVAAAGAAPTIAAGSAPTTAAGSAPAPRASHTQADGAAALAAALTGEPAPAVTAAASPTVLARADVSTALSNFAALSKAIQATFTPDGLRIDAVTAGSLFAKAGLVAGDLVTSVDGKPLRSLDDAADLYARASKARTVNAQVVRGGKPVAVRVAIQ